MYMYYIHDGRGGENLHILSWEKTQARTLRFMNFSNPDTSHPGKFLTRNFSTTEISYPELLPHRIFPTTVFSHQGHFPPGFFQTPNNSHLLTISSPNISHPGQFSPRKNSPPTENSPEIFFASAIYFSCWWGSATLYPCFPTPPAGGSAHRPRGVRDWNSSQLVLAYYWLTFLNQFPTTQSECFFFTFITFITICGLQSMTKRQFSSFSN